MLRQISVGETRGTNAAEVVCDYLHSLAGGGIPCTRRCDADRVRMETAIDYVFTM